MMSSGRRKKFRGPPERRYNRVMSLYRGTTGLTRLQDRQTTKIYLDRVAMERLREQAKEFRVTMSSIIREALGLLWEEEDAVGEKERAPDRPGEPGVQAPGEVAAS